MPAELDHGSFGEPCAALRISDPRLLSPIQNKAVLLRDCFCPASTIVGTDSVSIEVPRFLQECTATFSAGWTAPLEATVFLPDQAALVHSEVGQQLVEESLWHSHLFYSSFFRNDRSTGWGWRTDHGWAIDNIVEEPVNFCYHRFYHQYFHWFMDSLPRIWLLDRYSPDASHAKWCVAPRLGAFQEASLALFGIGPDRTFWPEGATVHFKQAIIPAFEFREPLQTRPSYNSGLHHKGWSAEYLSDIRDRASRLFDTGRFASPARIYISRGDASHRKVRNEDEILRFLEKLGFTAVTPGEHSLAEQVRLFSGAEVIIGVHGAGLTNIMWTKPGATVLEIMPERLDDAGYRFLSNLQGHHHHLMFARQFPHHFGDAYGDIEIDTGPFTAAVQSLLLQRGDKQNGLATCLQQPSYPTESPEINGERTSEISGVSVCCREAAGVGQDAEADKLLSKFEKPCETLADWQEATAFFEKLRMYARVEVSTRHFISCHRTLSSKPYFRLASMLNISKSFEEARSTVRTALDLFGDQLQDRWEVVNLLYAAMGFEDCLHVVLGHLRSCPTDFPYRAMECRALWNLGEHRIARKKLRRMRSLLGDDSSEWTWFVAIAKEFDDFSSAKRITGQLAEKLQSEFSIVTRSAFSLISGAGYVTECRHILREMQPESCVPDELEFFFDTAIQYGAIDTAIRFGKYIMSTTPNADVRERLKSLVASVSRFSWMIS